jgi:hypothetical protein
VGRFTPQEPDTHAPDARCTETLYRVPNCTTVGEQYVGTGKIV